MTERWTYDVHPWDRGKVEMRLEELRSEAVTARLVLVGAYESKDAARIDQGQQVWMRAMLAVDAHEALLDRLP